MLSFVAPSSQVRGVFGTMDGKIKILRCSLRLGSQQCFKGCLFSEIRKKRSFELIGSLLTESCTEDSQLSRERQEK